MEVERESKMGTMENTYNLISPIFYFIDEARLNMPSLPSEISNFNCGLNTLHSKAEKSKTERWTNSKGASHIHLHT